MMCTFPMFIIFDCAFMLFFSWKCSSQWTNLQIVTVTAWNRIDRIMMSINNKYVLYTKLQFKNHEKNQRWSWLFVFSPPTFCSFVFRTLFLSCILRLTYVLCSFCYHIRISYYRIMFLNSAQLSIKKCFEFFI